MNQHLQDSLLQQLEAELASTYRKLVSSRYFSPAHLEVLSLEAKRTIESYKKEDRLTAYMLYIQSVYQKAKQEDKFAVYDRRLAHFFQALTIYINEQLAERLGSKKERAFVKMLLAKLRENAAEEDTPYPNLLLHCLSNLSADSLDYLDRLFDERLSRTAGKETAVAISYFYLFIGKEVIALKTLQSLSGTLLPHDAEPHFKLLAKRERFSQIVHWLNALFSQSRSQLGSLQPYADQAETALQSATIHYGSWDRWLHAPSFKRFKSLTAPLSAAQIDAVLGYILPKLASLLHSDAAKLTYVQLLHEYAYYEEARDYFLTAEPNPIAMQEPKILLLEGLAAEKPLFALPVYHQFIVRLAERRSRKHYIEAADYTMKLKNVYDAIGERERYERFVYQLKQSYKTYRAFIEELKRREL